MTGTGHLSAVKLGKVRIGNGLTSKRGNFGGAGQVHCELKGATRFTGPDELDCLLHRHLKCYDAVVRSCKDGSQTPQQARIDSN